MDQSLPQVEAAPVADSTGLLNMIMNASDAIEPLPPPTAASSLQRAPSKESAWIVSVAVLAAGCRRTNGQSLDHFFSTKQTGMGMG